MSEGRTKIAGVAGNPISHSLSPRLHGYWLKKYSIDGDYAAFHVATNELADFIARLRINKIEGINLTVPHKEHAMSLVDELDGAAKKIGAVNTVYFNEAGKLVGSNTDGYGFLKHLIAEAPDWSAKAGPAIILGAGGAARAAIVSLLSEKTPEIRLVNRTLERAEKLALEMDDNRINVIPWTEREAALKDAALLVNVTTLGMTGQPKLDLDLDNLPVNAVVYDIVYNPLETELLKRASARGNVTVDGLGMLLHQAVPGFKAWFGVEPEVDEDLRNHLIEALK